MGHSKSLLEKFNESYYKRYKCPECNEYHFHVANPLYGECEEGFITGEKPLIQSVVDSDDFDGYFTDDELENDFI
ncbi:hypothetical protein [Lysinibacillus capsici]|uniref:hypothetical protein n=1 Tax=Lysinibacillus capsici TaxID=2115968 RepID=UPI0034E56539